MTNVRTTARDRVSNGLAQLNLNRDDGGPTDDGDEVKSAISTIYDTLAETWEMSELWNWGYSAAEIEGEIDKLIPGYSGSFSDGFSEQLYFYVLRQAPLDMLDYGGRRILEVGSGLGAGLNFLSRFVGAQMDGIDISRKAVARAGARYSRSDAIAFSYGDAESIPFAEGTFDVVINIESSHNYPRLDAFLAEVARVLRPGGYFSMADLFSDQRKEKLDKAKAGCADLEWVAENDISEQVKSAIRKRMAPDSYVQTTFSKLRSPLVHKIIGKHIWVAAFGGLFTGEASNGPVAKWARKMGGVSTLENSNVRAYMNHVAVRRS